VLGSGFLAELALFAATPQVVVLVGEGFDNKEEQK
jgi:hypothetical protein